MKKYLFLIAAFGFLSVTSFAQTRVIRGKLTAFNRYPVENVEVAAKKAKSSVLTDSLGEFTLVCNEKDIIQIRGKVFERMTRRVQKGDEYIQANLIFRDTPKNREIATGLGYISEEILTFALTHLEDENNDFCNFTDVFSLIRGKFPGVQIRGSSAGGEGVFIRGQKSITQDTEAIYVVDGVQVSDISFVNPCEMVSIDILKDGGAAIYGSQAANGVVVIETKK
ncbi:MAG TPA: TonB-dependent receptor [Bacteroides sp.]|nr:TonB-dependent receptor [Bacteroides sp.]